MDTIRKKNEGNKRKIRKIMIGHKGRSVYHPRLEENNKELSPEKRRTWVKSFILCAYSVNGQVWYNVTGRRNTRTCLCVHQPPNSESPN